MSNYNSENTTILATIEENGNVKALLLHECKDGSLQYVIADHFHEKRYDGTLGYERFDYKWSWGNYFDNVLDAADYWRGEIAPMLKHGIYWS